MDLLNEAMEIKAKGGPDARPYRRKEFDKIWGEYNVSGSLAAPLSVF